MKKKIRYFLLTIVVCLFFAVPVQAAEAKAAQLDCITDTVGILDEKQWSELEAKARSVTENYQSAVYLVILDDYKSYMPTMESSADAICQVYNLGYGEEKEGLILVISLANRDYILNSMGMHSNSIFNDIAKMKIEEAFLDDFARNDWYTGFMDYLNAADSVYVDAANGKNSSEVSFGAKAVRAYGIGAVIAVVISFIVCSVFKGQMKTAVSATTANAYINEGGVDISVREDRYINTTRTVRVIRNNTSGGSRAGSNQRTGKF